MGRCSKTLVAVVLMAGCSSERGAMPSVDGGVDRTALPDGRAGAGGGAGDSGGQPSDAAGADADSSVTPWPTAVCLTRAADLVSQMTLAEKIGQMTQADRKFLVSESDIASYFLGSLLSGGDSAPEPNTPDSWANMLDRFHQSALSTRLGIPLLYGIDAVHGHNSVVGAVVFPHNIGLGATRDPVLVERAARITALEMTGTGINWAFSPVLAAARDERWGRTYEAFGETPELAGELGAAAIRGFQDGRLGASATSVLACAKHFAGDGGTEGGVDQGDVVLDDGELRRLHIAQYEPAIAAGVGSIMVSYSSVRGLKMHENKHLLSDVLKGELGFRGFLISDWRAIDQLPGTYDQQVEASINAGLDMIMVPEDYATFIQTLTSLVPDRVPLERIDDAVTRILLVKCELGLFERRATVDRELTATIGSSEHRAVARQAVQKSLVLLKNDGILPLSPSVARIHLAGRSADSLGNQSGGWTVSWQGSSSLAIPGTTIRNAVAQAAAGAQVTYSLTGSGAAGADVGIAVIGETPYAEYFGDRSNLSLAASDVSVVQTLRAAGIPVVVVLVSGRPLYLETVLDDANAVVAAWLPGSEGGGVADVLFGAVAPTGKLGHSWPRSSTLSVNVGDAAYDPLFAYGFGLSY